MSREMFVPKKFQAKMLEYQAQRERASVRFAKWGA
jgi:hypothetical protein